MKLPGPVAAVYAKVTTLDELHPYVWAAVLLGAGALLLWSACQDNHSGISEIKEN